MKMRWLLVLALPVTAAVACGAATCIVDAGGRTGAPAEWNFEASGTVSAVAGRTEFRSSTSGAVAIAEFDDRHFETDSLALGVFNSGPVGLCIIVR